MIPGLFSALGRGTLIGKWLFVSLIYNGQPMPMPNPNLKLMFEFQKDGISRLQYHREGEVGQCDRLADYKIKNRKIWQKVTWVSPDNAEFCSEDPDMQLGTESEVEAHLKEGSLYMTLKMGEDHVIYVFQSY